jgi:PAS domain S-box-containing protein
VVDQVFWRKDGTPLAVEYTTAAVQQDGAHNSAVISFRDITERLESHQELARRTGANHP